MEKKQRLYPRRARPLGLTTDPRFLTSVTTLDLPMEQSSIEALRTVDTTRRQSPKSVLKEPRRRNVELLAMTSSDLGGTTTDRPVLPSNAQAPHGSSVSGTP
jgi:hypothetical protein